MAVTDCNYNCVDLPEYDSNIEACGSNTRNGGASAIILLECDAVLVDPSDAVEVQALIDAGDATIVNNVRFGFGDASAIAAPEAITSCGTAPITNYTRTGTLKDYKVSITNATFWNAAKQRSFGGMLVFGCGTDGLTDLVYWVDAEVKIAETMTFPDTDESPLFFSVTTTWKSINDPGLYVAPVGIV